MMDGFTQFLNKSVASAALLSCMMMIKLFKEKFVDTRGDSKIKSYFIIVFQSTLAESPRTPNLLDQSLISNS